jgi:heparosan-N-sulfate-glucuronate 5-epimerase
MRLFHKWIKMLNKNSIFHIKQSAGLYYSKDSVKGYYSDLRHKVRGDIIFDENGVPINITSSGNKVYFPITIFQYGLGAYDLYLETNDKQYINKFFDSTRWALCAQELSGAWDAFGWLSSDGKYSSMAQGEGASLLIRAYLHSRDKKYLDSAKKAIDFMLIPVNKGGTTIYYSNGGLTFEEKKQNKTVLNGAIFSIWGLWDYCIVTDDNKYKKVLQTSIAYLSKILPEFDCKYWSLYDLDGNIASPFYHDLHVEQLKVMYDLTGNGVFDEYMRKWASYQNSFIKSRKSFVIKSVQKLKQINNAIDLVK